MSSKVEHPIVAASRPLPTGFDVPCANVRFGPERGFPTRAAMFDFFHGAHALVTWVSERVDEELLEAVGPQLKIVSNFAVGFDNIDVAACKRRGVFVSNTPDAVTEGTADLAMLLLLAAARKLSAADRFARSGAWEGVGILGPNDWIGLPLAGRTLLIVGGGRIGYATAMRSVGWNMKVLYTARSAKPKMEAPPLNGRRVELEEGLREADFVSLHVPLTPETRGLINAPRLALMKKDAVLVNTCRGAVVDEAALADALAAGRLFAAGLDVFEKEPVINAKLKGLDNVVLAPHYGSASRDSRSAMSALCAANIRSVLGGGLPVTPVWT